MNLVASSAQLSQRIQGDVDVGLRNPDAIERSIARVAKFDHLDTAVLDVSEMNVGQTVNAVLKLV